jgi:hypothetical protein
MCAINPTHEYHLTISVYTSLKITQEEFRNLTISKLVEAEQQLNADGRLRFHIQDLDEDFQDDLDAVVRLIKARERAARRLMTRPQVLNMLRELFAWTDAYETKILDQIIFHPQQENL